MDDDLLFVIDETGTTNRPDLSGESDFGVGGVIFEAADTSRLVDAARQIGDLVKKKDYKYKHVQSNTDARRVFVEAVMPLVRPAGVFGFYSPGASLLNEKDRAVQEMSFLGTDDQGVTASIAEAIRGGDGDAHLQVFLDYLASCVITYSGGVGRSIQVCWDRRTDLEQLQQYCDELRDYYRSHPSFGDISGNVSFSHVADGERAAIARLAGVLAGDVRFFFRKHGGGIWSRLADAVRVTKEPTIETYQYENLANITRVAVVDEAIADAAALPGSKDTCMLRQYADRFISGHLSFASPEGKMGHLLIRNASNWEIHQIPD